MAEGVAVNASPLIHLAQAGLLDLLRGQQCPIVFVPRSVATEILRGRPDDPAVAALGSTEWLEVVADEPIPAVIAGWDLGPGESAVLAFAHAGPGRVAIIDDLAARRCAASLGIEVRGTLGIVLVARRQGRIPAARPVLEQLRRSGMFLSDRVLERALAMVGE